MKLHPFDVPVAVSMLDLVKTATEPFQQFICYWIAFNNIYAVTADMNGLSAFVITKPDGSPKTRVIANLKIAVSSGPKEIEQIASAWVARQTRTSKSGVRWIRMRTRTT
jgi:hypothetical protein